MESLLKRARIAALMAACVALSGCNHVDLGAVLGALALTIALIILIQFIVWAAMFVILAVNIVKLGQGKPSHSWGGIGVVMGAMTGLPAFPLLSTHFNAMTIGSIAFSAALVYFGYKNIRGATDLERWKRLGQR